MEEMTLEDLPGPAVPAKWPNSWLERRLQRQIWADYLCVFVLVSEVAQWGQ